jgi:cytoskeletal protein CcmA (bactofilin family)
MSKNEPLRPRHNSNIGARQSKIAGAGNLSWEIGMVFNRRSDPVPPEAAMPTLRRPERPIPVHGNAAPSPQMPTMGHNTGLVEQSLIGSDLSIEGQSITVRCKGTLRINGNIQADLHSRGLEVGREAVISGSISADQVDVYGRVNGAINGQRVTLHATAEVEGDIHSQSLSIEHGASFDGRSRRVTNAAEVAPQLESASAIQNAAPRPAAPMPTPAPAPVSQHVPFANGVSPQQPSMADRLNGSTPHQN